MMSKLCIWIVLLCAACFGQQAPNYDTNFGTMSATKFGSTQVRRFAGPTYGTGTVVLTMSGLTGAPSACTVSLYSGGITITPSGTTANGSSSSASTNSFNPSVGDSYKVLRVGIVGSVQPSIAGFVTWTCATFPTAGSISFEFVPDINRPEIYSFSYQNANNNCLNLPFKIHNLIVGTAGTAETIQIWSGLGCSGAIMFKAVSPAQGTYSLDLYSDVGASWQATGTTAGDYTLSVSQ
jgi:hypothetical protein